LKPKKAICEVITWNCCD